MSRTRTCTRAFDVTYHYVTYLASTLAHISLLLHMHFTDVVVGHRQIKDYIYAAFITGE